VDFDSGGNVTNATTFTIQTAGTYAVAGQLNWGTGDVGVRTVTVFDGDLAIYSVSTGSASGPITLPFASTATFAEGDVVTIAATHSLTTNQSVLPGSMLMCLETSPEAPSAAASSGTSTVQTFTASASYPAMTVIQIDENGDVTFIDPTVVMTDTAGNVITPFADGVALQAATLGESVQVGTTYGGIFQVEGSNFTVGGLLYVGVGGLATQNYDSLLTEVQWVICMGKALTSDSFLYEPHIPQRTVVGF
jgi:hypothetical protein